MRVHVDETGNDPSTAQIDYPVRYQRSASVTRLDTLDAPALDHDRHIVPGACTSSVNNRGVLKDESITDGKVLRRTTAQSEKDEYANLATIHHLIVSPMSNGPAHHLQATPQGSPSKLIVARSLRASKQNAFLWKTSAPSAACVCKPAA
jgi:hypothetical protein